MPVITTLRLPFMLISVTSHPQAAVHEQHLARDERGLVGAEEAYRSGDVLRPAETAERRVGQDHAPYVLGQHVGQRRLDVARSDCVRPHAARRQLAGQRLREPDDARLRRRVVRLPRIAVEADDAGHVDDRPAALAHHPAGGSAAGVEDAAEVRVENCVPVLVRHPRDQPVPRQARVVDEDVQVAGFLDQACRLVRVGDVGLDCAAADLRGEGLRLVRARAVADDDLCACSCQLGRDRAADPARGAGDERELALQRAELTHRYVVESNSLIFSSEVRSLTEIAFTLRSIRLTRPESTLLGPTSTKVRTPSLTSSDAACVKRTGAVSWSTSNGAMRCADSMRAVTVDMNGATGSSNFTRSIAGRNRSAARATSGEWN